MLTGTVKWFDDKKGFGFIVYGGTDYFVHYKDILSEKYKTLGDGEKVEFSPEVTPKGLVARKVLRLPL